MKLENAVVFVTGAYRGIGLEFARQALAMGARKVYVGAGNPATVRLPRVVPVRLDLKDPEQVVRVAAACSDVTLVINNTGIKQIADLFGDDDDDALRAMFDTNLQGIGRVSRAFAPVLGANGGGALLNVLSMVSWFSPPGMAVHAAAKSATWKQKGGLCRALHEQGTQVLGMHASFTDSDHDYIRVPKLSPAFMVERAYAALEQGQSEVFIGEVSPQVKRSLCAQPDTETDSAQG